MRAALRTKVGSETRTQTDVLTGIACEDGLSLTRGVGASLGDRGEYERGSQPDRGERLPTHARKPITRDSRERPRRRRPPLHR